MMATQLLCCYFCRGYFGRYQRAATIELSLYCRTCKGDCVFEAKDGHLVCIRFEPKHHIGGADNPPPVCSE